MDFTKITMEELNQMKTELNDEITRRIKSEEQKAIKEFIDAFTKVINMGMTVTYDDWDDTYTLINPSRFRFKSL